MSYNIGGPYHKGPVPPPQPKTMDPVSISAIAGAGMQAGNFAYKIATRKKDRKWALEDYERSMEDQRANWDRDRNAALADWNMTNEYNSPANQVRLYKEAGLHPALALGSPSVEAAAIHSPQGGNPPSIRGDYGGKDLFDPSAASSFAQLALNAEQQRMSKQQLQGQLALMNAQTLKALTDVDAKALDTQLKRDTYDELVRAVGLRNDETSIDMDYTMQQIRASKQGVEESSWRIVKIQNEIKKIQADTDFTINEDQRKSLMATLERGKVTAETQMLMQRIITEKKNQLLRDAEVAKTQEEKDRINKQATLLQKSINTWDQTNARAWISTLLGGVNAFK